MAELTEQLNSLKVEKVRHCQLTSKTYVSRVALHDVYSIIGYAAMTAPRQG